ncbi:hypothetical protein [Ruminococcus champanellensis]|uniref:hypothetical protein n=1 Tax=Ruminococcus champanellensis TaxID=1161942 RepID=UPI00248B8B34|nr:hypothetical protein [Ruminococcus champanellensis]
MKPTDLQTQFDFDKEAREQAERVKHTKLEKDYSYFDSCRETMAEIEKTNRSAFFYTCFACFIIAFTAMFKQRFQIFSSLGYALGEPDSFAVIFCGGAMQIFLAILVVIVGYLAWANFHKLNIALFALYAAMCLLGVYHVDLPSLGLGLLGAAMYIRAMLTLPEEERLSKLEGYPYFNERLELSKQDFDKEPLHPDSPDKDRYYMDSLTRRTLEGKEEEKRVIPKKETAPVSLPEQPLQPLEEVLSDKPVYTAHTQKLPELNELTLGDTPTSQVAPEKSGKGAKHGKRKKHS